MIKVIIAQLEVDVAEPMAGSKSKLIRKVMTVIHSTHPTYKAGKKFDYGYLSIALDEGYVVTILPLP